MSVSAPRKTSPPTRKREKLYFDLPFTKAAPPADGGSGDLVLSGYASTWALDRDDEMVAPNAFDSSLAEYLKNNPIVLWQHDQKTPIGRVTAAKADATGLYVTVLIPNPGSDAADWQKGAYVSIKNGVVSTFSIGGYFTRDVDMGPDGPVFTIVDVELFEISCVSIPANAGSIFDAMVKAYNGETPPMSPKAVEQMEQLLGFADITDLELVGMDDGQRAKRYEALTELFKRSHDGAEPPPMGTWTQLNQAKTAGASPIKVASAKLMAVREFYLPEPSEKAGRSISAANQDKLQKVLDAHKSLEKCMIAAAEQMKTAASHHGDAQALVKEVMGIDGEDEEAITDEDEQGDEAPNSPEKATAEHEFKSVAEEKQLISDISRSLSEAGQAVLDSLAAADDDEGTEIAGDGTTDDDDDDYSYCYVDDFDLDRGLVVYCCYGRRITDRYIQVPFTRNADGTVTVDITRQVAVEPTRGYRPKGLWKTEGKGMDHETPNGVVRRVTSDGKAFFLLQCPGCKTWGRLDDDQLHGRVSVDHAADGCPGGYHETHDFAADLPEEMLST